MRTFTYSWMKRSLAIMRKSLIVIMAASGITTFSQALTQEFIDAGYTLTDLGSINLLPSQYGGLTIRPEQPNTLYIGGYANTTSGMLYTVPLQRDPVTHHITGFAGDATEYVAAPNNDGGIFFAPNGTLLFTMYNMNQLGQVLTDNTFITTSLDQYGIASSVGSIALVPAGYPGAGNLIFASYNAGIMYNIPYTIDGTGKYILSNKTAEVNVNGPANGPEGIAFIPIGSAGFQNPSMVVSSYSNDVVVVFELDAVGLPVPATARQMVTGLSGAEGAWIDPVTGDFIFSTFGGGDKIIRISGFEAPSAIWDNSPDASSVFKLFPNPTTGPVNVELLEKGASGTLEIYNIAGERIIRQSFSGNGITGFDLSNQPDGAYFIKVDDGTRIVSQHFVKQ